jgi:subfamily B ATP-binding cassette protein MsbA
MKDALRLAGYAKRYWHLLAISVLLMAIMGAMTAFRALLIRPVLGRVIRPAADATPEPIFTILHHKLYLEQIFPASIHNIFAITSRFRFWWCSWCAASAIIWAIT